MQGTTGKVRTNDLWTPTHIDISVGRPTKTYIYPLCSFIGCRPEDLPRIMDDSDGWWDRKS